MRGTVEIVGGGIGGLFTGFVLANSGWRVRINERAPDIREIGSGIFLKNNSIVVLEHLGIAEQVLGRAIWLRRAEVRDHHDRILQRRTLMDAARVFNLPRADLVLGLAEAARRAGAEILTSSPIRAATPGGRITFENGDARDADLIIAADGFRSKLRDEMGLKIVAKELANGATRFLVPRSDFEPEDMTREWWSGRRRIGIAPASMDWTYAYMSCPESDFLGTALPVNVETWKESFLMLAPFFEKVRVATGGTRFAYTYARCSRWFKGRVALIGDAAHSMPPTLGQGAGCTIMNAYVLCDELARANDVPAALAAWEQRIRYVTDETQKWALRYDALMSNWPVALSGVRRGVIWSFGRLASLNARMRIADRIRVIPKEARKQVCAP
jgi:2-polyprenyl-6-methoxyphenol hydroxylase-like FAD-dependent oxidoreductase